MKSKLADKAPSAIEFFIQPPNLEKVAKSVEGRFVPVYRDHTKSDFWQTSKFAEMRKIAENADRLGTPRLTIVPGRAPGQEQGAFEIARRQRGVGLREDLFDARHTCQRDGSAGFARDRHFAPASRAQSLRAQGVPTA